MVVMDWRLPIIRLRLFDDLVTVVQRIKEVWINKDRCILWLIGTWRKTEEGGPTNHTKQKQVKTNIIDNS